MAVTLFLNIALMIFHVLCPYMWPKSGNKRHKGLIGKEETNIFRLVGKKVQWKDKHKLSGIFLIILI